MHPDSKAEKIPLEAYEAPEKMYRGGVSEHDSPVEYYTPNKEMAQSYVGMSNDRFGSGGELHESNIRIKNPAPINVIQREAKNLKIDNGLYTPASVFDTSLHDEAAVRKLVAKLQKLGYDGAILDDIAYGKQISDKAHIVFKKGK